MRMRDQVPIATLQTNISTDSIDETNGIIPGCRLCEVNRVARFRDGEGKSKSLEMTPSLVDGLLSLAVQEGRLDAYWTHDRLKGSSDHINDSIGMWSNFRKDDSGNLIADLNLEPSAYREKILWKASKDKKGIMTSLVFDYKGGEKDAVALNIFSGDLVRFGAATTGLLSQDKTQNNTMEPKEFAAALVAALSTPEVATALKAVLAADKPEDKPLVSDEDCAAMEKDAGVTDADRKPEDKDKPAFLRAQLACNRANARLAKDRDASAVIAAKASLAAEIGKGGKIVNLGEGQNKDGETFEQAKLAALAAGCKSESHAIAFVAAHKPELYNTFMGAK